MVWAPCAVPCSARNHSSPTILPKPPWVNTNMLPGPSKSVTSHVTSPVVCSSRDSCWVFAPSHGTPACWVAPIIQASPAGIGPTSSGSVVAAASPSPKTIVAGSFHVAGTCRSSFTCGLRAGLQDSLDAAVAASVPSAGSAGPPA